MIYDTKPTYTRYELKRTLTDVFKSVYFVDFTQKMRMQYSYFDNFDLLVDYARAKGIDEKQYIRSIRKNLLACPHTYRVR